MPVSDCAEANRGVSSMGRMVAVIASADVRTRRRGNALPTRGLGSRCALCAMAQRALYQRPDRGEGGGAPARRQASAPRLSKRAVRIMTDDLEMRRRRAAYRARHRGTKEMDSLLGRFADAQLAAMERGGARPRSSGLLALPDPDAAGLVLDAATARRCRRVRRADRARCAPIPRTGGGRGRRDASSRLNDDRPAEARRPHRDASSPACRRARRAACSRGSSTRRSRRDARRCCCTSRATTAASTRWSRRCRFFAPKVRVISLPAWDTVPYDRVGPNAEIVARAHHRAGQARARRRARSRPIVLTTVNAILQRVPPRELHPRSAQADRARPAHRHEPS